MKYHCLFFIRVYNNLCNFLCPLQSWLLKMDSPSYQIFLKSTSSMSLDKRWEKKPIVCWTLFGKLTSSEREVKVGCFSAFLMFFFLFCSPVASPWCRRISRCLRLTSGTLCRSSSPLQWRTSAWLSKWPTVLQFWLLFRTSWWISLLLQQQEVKWSKTLLWFSYEVVNTQWWRCCMTASGFDPGLEFLSMWSFCVCFLWVLWFPSTDQEPCHELD